MHLRRPSSRLPFGGPRPASVSAPAWVASKVAASPSRGISPTERSWNVPAPRVTPGAQQPLVNYRPPAAYDTSAAPGGLSAFQAGEWMMTAPGAAPGDNSTATVSNVNAPLGPSLDPEASSGPSTASIIGGIALLAAVAGGAWYFMGGKKK